ncbi:uncharacterized protein LOC110601023 isoform X3 [Manihot esculenta]|nr:uncharacterized protein LOC110601023 isoform X3 [Manihot esculenta]XP_043807168.1 uncharacterized protein LOC110601023 isoform X3 [Manihot esculenta]XP_043807169.1 uncharacterized protein LOC110601023 isoform X3 [Manihot esculenta]XP_043807170.1 uncharacterized protein LOC110601023 isoform X3 [Manihot esculenta]
MKDKFSFKCLWLQAFRGSQEPAVNKLKEPILDEITAALVSRFELNFTRQDTASMWFLCKQVEENMRLRTELQKKIQELEKYVLKLENMDKTRHWKIVGCSAYTGEGLLEGFDWLVQDMMIP